MILVQSLWVLLLMILSLGSLAGHMHRSIVEERASWQHTQLRTAAASGLFAHMVAIKADLGLGYSHRGQAFVQDPALNQFALPDSIRVYCYGPSELGQPRLSTFYPGGIDEESRLSIITAAEEEILRLPGVSSTMVTALLAYRQDRRRLPLEASSDLRSIPGWENVDLTALDPLIGFYGSGLINLNTASAEVLYCAGLSRPAANAWAALRVNPAFRSEGTGGLVLKSLHGVDIRLLDAGLDRRHVAEITNLVNSRRFTVQSHTYRIHSRAVSLRDGQQVEVQAVVDLVGSQRILFWREVKPS